MTKSHRRRFSEEYRKNEKGTILEPGCRWREVPFLVVCRHTYVLCNLAVLALCNHKKKNMLQCPVRWPYLLDSIVYRTESLFKRLRTREKLLGQVGKAALHS